MVSAMKYFFLQTGMNHGFPQRQMSNLVLVYFILPGERYQVKHTR